MPDGLAANAKRSRSECQSPPGSDARGAFCFHSRALAAGLHEGNRAEEGKANGQTEVRDPMSSPEGER